MYGTERKTNRVLWTRLCLQQQWYRFICSNWKGAIMIIEQNSKHAAHETQIRQTGRKESTHTWHRLIETGKYTRNANIQGMCGSKTDAVIDKVPSYGFTFRRQMLHEVKPLDSATEEIGEQLIVFVFFVCLFVGIKPGNPYRYFDSRPGLQALGVYYPLGPRSSSCGPTKVTPLPRTTLRANWGQRSESWRVGSHPWTYASPIQTHPQPPGDRIASRDLPRLIPLSIITQGILVP